MAKGRGWLGPGEGWRSASRRQGMTGRGIHRPSAPAGTVGATRSGTPLAERHASQLQAALDYSARRLLAELDAPARRAPTETAIPDDTLTARLTAASTGLLRWWFSAAIARTRVDNFHVGQREAILHTILAHEAFGTDDAELLHRRACLPAMADAAQEVPRSPGTRFALAGTHAGGGRWIAQALIVWQWANRYAMQSAGRDDARFSDRFTLVAGDAQHAHRWSDGLLGPVIGGALRDCARASVLRHARLFLPPALRAPFQFWLTLQACAGDGLRIIHDAGHVPHGCTLIAGRTPRLASGLPAPPYTGSEATPLRAPPTLCVHLRPASTRGQCADNGPCLSEFSLARAIRHGAAKLPLLEVAPATGALRTTACRQPGLRPRLSRDHASQLSAGLRALDARTQAFTGLDAARAPRMLVLCDAPHLLRAARRHLLALGVAADDILVASASHAQAARIVVAPLDARIAPDARTCVLVVLRTHRPAPDASADTLLTRGAPVLWPEPEFARLQAIDRERAGRGQPPATLLDVLSVIEHPQAAHLHAPLLRAGLATRMDARQAAIAPVGDLLAVDLRSDAARHDIHLPPTCADIAVLASPQRLSDLPRRILRASRSLPVRKSIHPLAGWHEDDNGFRRGFIEAAEADPAIDSHCLLDPRRHACRNRDTWLALGMDGRGRIDALARTATHVFMIEFLADGPSRPQRPDAGEQALALWRRRTNTLPPEQRADRLWQRVRLQAPLFWSCKRHGVPLAALLSALADTRCCVPARPRPVPV